MQIEYCYARLLCYYSNSIRSRTYFKMTTNLLQKEKEYRKLNEELQNYNKKLMEEFNDVIKKQENFLKEPVQSEIGLSYTQSPDIKNKENYQDILDHHVNTDIPESVNCIGMKGVIYFYKAKLAAMQNEFNLLQHQHKDKCEEVKKIAKDTIKLAEERDKWRQTCNNNKGNVSKLENQVSAQSVSLTELINSDLQLATLSSKHQAREGEIIALKKEVDQLRKHLKGANLNASSCEMRVNRVMKENEKLKDLMKAAKEEVKALQETHRKEIVDVITITKRLEKQKTELLAAFKKQLQLVDNFKRQKAYLESMKLAEISETNFLRILD